MERLLDLLGEMGEHPGLRGKLALHGGIAINLFMLDVPRLSVDIDVSYVGAVGREEMMGDRPVMERSIEEVAQSQGYSVSGGGDESARIRREPPMYLMCATMFEPGSEEGLTKLVKAKPRGMRKLPWHDMEVREKVSSIEDLHIEHIKPCDDEPRLWVPDQILGAIGDMFSVSEETDKWGRYRDGVDRHISPYTVSA